ncbi:uncharacterized protein BDR25DRAFT_367221 [Lindgomyces ingoldianus]|uniref:Uncharacterized protein n=1 Tax=Lindgomyces ingoldianus TaxID=673940 RepID=A0ACB6QXC8_9PLEO|nr:uncharacterized protein BDR25DRAFT_367221 [Lindgomyces ingoldianus]KAF2471536.1 hypothetical protein BDR25DRAFT_367221 [Lindgomyces ingoldianus]
MASFGIVVDVLDDRFLHLQDVTGNVRPFPTLVPYEDYSQNVLVYKMDMSHEMIMGSMQQFTVCCAKQSGKETWSWVVQWEVEKSSPAITHDSAPAPKKLRIGRTDLDLGLSPKLPFTTAFPPSSPKIKPRAPLRTGIGQRRLDPGLMEEEGLLRILIDIVQCDDRIVPNLIEFLYNWIDFYEGDGHALQCAMHQEIPSLWDFECHPLVLPGVKKAREQKAQDMKKSEAKPDEKPDVTALEEDIELSERMQYHEKRFGIQPPKIEVPITPLINIPKDMRKRNSYYAACFQSRQRAIYLLLEAGITMKQINNYIKLQKMPPKETPEEGAGGGLTQYFKNQPYARAQFFYAEKVRDMRKKWTETVISTRLGREAQYAARTAEIEASVTALQGSPETERNASGHLYVPPPIIPPTPSQSNAPETAPNPCQLTSPLSSIETEHRVGHTARVETVPAFLSGRLKSNRFASARPAKKVNKDESSDEDGSDSEYFNIDGEPVSDEDDVRMDTNDAPGNLNMGVTLQPSATAPTRNAQPRNIAAYLQSLSPAQIQDLMPMINAARQPGSNFIMPPAYATHAATHGQPSHSNVGSANVVSAPAIAAGSQIGSQPSGSNGSADEDAKDVKGDNLEEFGDMEEDADEDRDGIPTSAALPEASTQYPREGSTSIPQASSGLTQGFQPLSFSAQFTAPAQPLPSLLASPRARSSSTQDGASRQLAWGAPSILFRAPQSPLDQILQNVHQNPVTTQTPARFRSPPSQSNAQPPTGAQQLRLSAGLASNSQRLPSVFSQPPMPSLSRTPPSPLELPTTTPASTLAKLAFLMAPKVPSPLGIPVLIYLPKILFPEPETLDRTDAILLGYIQPGTGGSEKTDMRIEKALFLPEDLSERFRWKVKQGTLEVLETYAAPATAAWSKMPATPSTTSEYFFSPSSSPKRNAEQLHTSHKSIYDKLFQAYNLMVNTPDRESQLTKRWRCSPDPVMEGNRGSVWEGWGLCIDRGVGMGDEERKGAVVRVEVGSGAAEREVREWETRRAMDAVMEEGEEDRGEGIEK